MLIKYRGLWIWYGRKFFTKKVFFFRYIKEEVEILEKAIGRAGSSLGPRIDALAFDPDNTLDCMSTDTEFTTSLDPEVVSELDWKQVGPNLDILEKFESPTGYSDTDSVLLSLTDPAAQALVPSPVGLSAPGSRTLVMDSLVKKVCFYSNQKYILLFF